MSGIRPAAAAVVVSGGGEAAAEEGSNRIYECIQKAVVLELAVVKG
jgi:hypothetical protein